MNKEIKKTWMTTALKAAGALDLSVGVLVLLVPSLAISVFGAAGEQDFCIYQFFGLFSAVFGITFLLASFRPLKNWVIVLAGLLSKLTVPLIFMLAAFKGNFPMEGAIVFSIFEIIWLIPFFLILKAVYDQEYTKDQELINMFSYDEMYSLDMFETSEGYDLQEMTEKWPTMVVFLRHMGCTFCKQTLADISKKRNNIEISGTRILLVHMSDLETATETLKQYGLEDLPQISDPEGILYKKFKLCRGSISSLFGPKVVYRGLLNIIKGHKQSAPDGDVFQMPGLFLLKNGKILRSFVHTSAADTPDYKGFASH